MLFGRKVAAPTEAEAVFAKINGVGESVSMQINIKLVIFVFFIFFIPLCTICLTF